MISMAGIALARSPALCRYLAARATSLRLVGADIFGHDPRPEFAHAGWRDHTTTSPGSLLAVIDQCNIDDEFEPKSPCLRYLPYFHRVFGFPLALVNLDLPTQGKTDYHGQDKTLAII